MAGPRRKALLKKAAPAIAELRADGLWLSDDLVAGLLAAVGEQP